MNHYYQKETQVSCWNSWLTLLQQVKVSHPSIGLFSILSVIIVSCFQAYKPQWHFSFKQSILVTIAFFLSSSSIQWKYFLLNNISFQGKPTGPITNFFQITFLFQVKPISPMINLFQITFSFKWGPLVWYQFSIKTKFYSKIKPINSIKNLFQHKFYFKLRPSI